MREYLPEKKNPLVIKACFSEGKLMKQYGNPPLFKRTPQFQPSPLFLSNFFMTKRGSLSKFQKQEMFLMLYSINWPKLIPWNFFRNFASNKCVTSDDKDPVWLNENIKLKIKAKNKVYQLQQTKNGLLCYWRVGT